MRSRRSWSSRASSSGVSGNETLRTRPLATPSWTYRSRYDDSRAKIPVTPSPFASPMSSMPPDSGGPDLKIPRTSRDPSASLMYNSVRWCTTMNDSDELAPAVAAILRTAEARGDPERGPVSVDARSLPAALADAEADGRVPVIAEVKPTSPTTEGTRDEDPVALAEEMVEGGAAALSVLTEPDHFGGSPENLRRIREAVDVPVLRKDFLVREAQLDTVEADVF